METSRVAFHMLVYLAQADGSLAEEEREILASYGRTLGIPAEEADRIMAAPRRPPLTRSDLPLGRRERTNLLGMLAQVAFADGAYADREKKRLEALAEALGAGPLELANILVEAEQGQAGPRRNRRRLLAGAAVLTALVLLIWLSDLWRGGRTRREVQQLILHHDEHVAQQAAKDLVLVERTENELARSTRELSDRITRLRDSLAENDAARRREEDRKGKEMAARLTRLQERLAEIQARDTVFKDMARRYDPAVLLILAQYSLVKGSRVVSRQGSGTGFIISANGLVVTNKHVIQGWKFDKDDADMIAQGWRVDTSSLIVAAWPAGSRLFSDPGRFNLQTAYTTLAGDLTVLTAAPDHLAPRRIRLPGGGFRLVPLHAHDNNDLILLQAKVARPVRAIPLARPGAKVEKLDPVMVLGFPAGPMILEGRTAETSPSLGEVRKVEETIYVTAPIVPGNSGGPLLDRAGRAIGISTRIAGEATLGSCIRTDHLTPLLPPALALLGEAENLAQAKQWEAARNLLSLARRRGAEKAAPHRVTRLHKNLAGH